MGARYWLPLPSPLASVEHGVQLGVDFKRSNNNLEFFGTHIFDDSTDIVPLVAQQQCLAIGELRQTPLRLGGATSCCSA